MTALRIRDLEKRFDDVVAIGGISLNVDEGELVSFLGPSGCGKTTTLRCVAGFEFPDSGEIRFGGDDMVNVLPEHRNIGMVFQNYALFPHMTVRGNLAFGLEMRGIAKSEIGARTDRALEKVQLAGLEDRFPRQLSGGQQQRVALARALVIEPSVLLLDEPLANLDAKLREEMRFFIRSLQKDIGITTVYVTHDQAEAMVISDRIVVMFDGVIHQIGDPASIYEHPETEEVANFIGLANFVPATALGAGSAGNWRLQSGGAELHCAYHGKLEAGEAVRIVVRPEAIELESPEGESRPSEANGEVWNAVDGEVQERFYLGNIAGYRIRCADGLILQVQAPPWAAFRVGEAVRCRFPAARTWIIGGGGMPGSRA